MKRLLTLLLAFVMVLSMMACGEEDVDNDRREQKQQTEAETAESFETVPTEETYAPTEETLPAHEEIWNTQYSSLWTITYDEARWNYGNRRLENYCAFWLEEYEEFRENSSEGEIYVVVKASVESFDSFLYYLNAFGIDARSYAEISTKDAVEISGISFLKHKAEYDGQPCYLYIGRNKDLGMTVYIRSSVKENTHIEQLLQENLKFTMLGEKVAESAWYWDGTPFAAENSTADVGGCTVSSTWLPFAEPVITGDRGNHRVAVYDDQAYILHTNLLNVYSFDGEGFTYSKTKDVDGKYKYICADETGVLWLSSLETGKVICIQNDAVIYESSEFRQTAVAPSGTWAFTWEKSPSCLRVSGLNGGRRTAEQITLPAVSEIAYLTVDEDQIYFSGIDKNGAYGMYVCDKNGKLQMTLNCENPEAFRQMVFFTKTATGYMGLSGETQQVMLWDASGNWIGAAEAAELFGAASVRLCSGVRLTDGSVLVTATVEHGEGSAVELTAFKIFVN